MYNEHLNDHIVCDAEAKVDIKLNIGCGCDYRSGYVNIDASSTLPRVDMVLDVAMVSLLTRFKTGTITHILANDFIEHHFHWEAVKLLKDFYALLKPDGHIEIRLPDCEHIISMWRLSTEQKITMIFGGQDIPQGQSEVMDASRKKNPEFFCHKYGWTRRAMKRELIEIGFRTVKTWRCGTNFVAIGYK